MRALADSLLGLRRPPRPSAVTEGERWVREVLLELRAASFAPRAWLRFLDSSLERAAELRRRRGRERRQFLAVGVLGVVAWGVVALAGEPALAGAGMAWWGLVIVMLDWHLGLLERPDGRPLGGLGLPNALSLARLWIVPALPLLPPVPLALALLAATATDVLDGAIARHRDEETRLGRWLDGAADGFVLAAAAGGAARAGLVPAWLALLVAARYALPWLGIALVYFREARAPSRESVVGGQIPGVLLVAGLALALFEQPGGVELAALGALGGLTTLAATILRTTRSRAVERRPAERGI